MKKFVAGATGALLLSAGLVASTGTAAHADPYPGTFATETTVNVPAKIKRKKTAKVCVTITVVNGTGSPTGQVTILVERNAGRFTQSSGALTYSGGQVCFVTRKLKKIGGYTVEASFDSAARVFQDSAGAAGFDVVKKRRR